ncbi:hypothetical protein LCGC14_0665680 [marine sediment metagenome]|uniref:Terminase large subunit gp17-like C-terminal domain-containing protein n=1 Tax=marine sediment metagenome TaxID=412755 RepID=A0A0F9RCG4_9ZZZZ
MVVKTPTVPKGGFHDHNPHLVKAVTEHFIEPLEGEKLSGPDSKKVVLARENLIDFTEHTYLRYKTEKFHAHICENLDKVVAGETRHLMLFAPPQHGKSELVSVRLPPFWLAKRPDMPIALISYGDTLAKRNSRMARDVFLTPQYKQVFPHMMPDKENWRMKDWHVANHKGYVISAGLDGPITGHGFGLGIIDDPIENWAAAQSDVIRENAWQWWKGTFKTRMWEEGSIILMMTRWHEEDLGGQILASEGRVEEGGRWKVLSYAAIAEEPDEKLGILPDILGREPGEALAPSRYSYEYLREIEKDAPRVFLAEYQQRPTKPKGQMFKIGNVNYVDSLPEAVGTLHPDTGELLAMGFGKGVWYVRYWDLAATEEEMFSRNPDYTVGTLMALYRTDKVNALGKKIFRPYVLDVIRRRLDPEGVADLIYDTAILDTAKVPIRIEQEGGAAGKTLIHGYIILLQGFDVDGDSPTGKKAVRATPIAGQFNAGNLLVLKAIWNREWLNELAGFPFGGHDDQVDSLSGAYKLITGEETRFRESKFVSV